MKPENRASYYKDIDLADLSKEEYETLNGAGMLHVLYPEACGIYEDDVMNRIDVIGQNGNDGTHYGYEDPLFGSDAAIKYNSSELKQGALRQDYRVPFNDTPDMEWPHVNTDSYTDKIKKVVEDTYATPVPKDIVNKPNHYKLGDTGMEAIDVIKAVLGSNDANEWLTPLQGGMYQNVLKYLLRAPKKNVTEDLQKAQKYLTWLLESLE